MSCSIVRGKYKPTEKDVLEEGGGKNGNTHPSLVWKVKAKQGRAFWSLSRRAGLLGSSRTQRLRGEGNVEMATEVWVSVNKPCFQHKVLERKGRSGLLFRG